jgi:S-layer homology domain
MMKKLTLISLVFLVFGLVLGGPLVARGKIVQSLVIGVKKDSGGGFTNADLNDRYWFRRLGILNFESNDREAEIVYGYIDFNGAGLWNGQFTIFESDGNSPAGNATTFNGTYSVETDGSLNIIHNAEPGTGHISIDSDTNFIVVSDGFTKYDGIHQAIVTAVRAPNNPFGLADLNGTWQIRDLEVLNFESDFREAGACTATIVINNPNWTADFNCFNSDNTTNTGTNSGTYTLSGNTYNLFETGNQAALFSAYLSRDGNILIFTRGRSSGGNIEQTKGIALKKTSKVFTNADLSGAYFIHDAVFEDFETVSREASITVGTVTFDGKSNWTGTANYFGSDGSSGSDNISGTYSVNSDGSFTLIDTSQTPNATLTGNISGDNNTIILSQRENTSIVNPLFSDVPPGHWAYDAIYKIYNAGITKGCSVNPLMYCPEDTVTRTQMAVFLGRAKHGSSFTPPSATGIFSDVPVSYWAAAWIEQFYNDGITGGCGTNPLRYCPGNNVTRAQMAIFLLRSKHGSNYTPPTASGIFSDVPVSYWAADWIEQLYVEGITTGCGTGPLRYCPENSVTRAQMAVFMMRTFGL